MSFDINSDQLQLHAFELKQSDTEKMNEYSAKLELTHNESINSHILLSIMQMIKAATCLADLRQIIIALNPLQQLKELLLNEVNKIRKNYKKKKSKHHKQATKGMEKLSLSRLSSTTTTRLSLNELYFKITAMDEILPDDTICSIISYVSGSNMYNKIPILNKHFNFIMKNYPLLFQNYTMKLPLYTNKALNVCVSHKLQLIQLSADNINIKNIIKHDKHCLHFIIKNIEEMNKYCPFMWDQINKWHFILNQPQQQSHQQYDNKWRVLMHQIITQSSEYIMSCNIKSSVHSNTINISNIDMSLLSYLNNLTHIKFPSNQFIHSFLNYNLQCNEILKNILYLDLLVVDDNAIKILGILNKVLVLKIQFEDDNLPLSPLSIIDKTEKRYRVIFPQSMQFLIVDGFHFFGSEHVLDFQQCSNIIGVSFKNSTFSQWMCNVSEELDNDLIRNTVNDHILWPKNENNIQCVLLDEVSNDFEGVWWRYFRSFQSSNINNCPNIKYLRYTSSPRLATCTQNYPLSHHNNVKFNTDNTGIINDTMSVKNISPLGLVGGIRLNKSETIIKQSVSDLDEAVTELENDTYYNIKRNGRDSRDSITNVSSNVYIPTPADIRINNPYEQLSPKSYRFPLFKSSLISINLIGENNDRNMLILSDENNDGCLWKLLLENKYRNEEENGKDKIAIYEKWFAMNICKWVYHFGSNTTSDIDTLSTLVDTNDCESFRSSIQPIDLENFFDTYYSADR